MVRSWVSDWNALPAPTGRLKTYEIASVPAAATGAATETVPLFLSAPVYSTVAPRLADTCRPVVASLPRSVLPGWLASAADVKPTSTGVVRGTGRDVVTHT